MSRPTLHGTACACCMPPALGRRGLFGLGLAAAGIGLAGRARAAEGHYDSMLLSCIDPRMVEPVHDWMDDKLDLRGKFSQFVIAGAAIGVVAPPFVAWQPAFWDNLATSVKLHHIHRVIVVDHRDCGAARIAYGDAAVATPQAETELHRAVTTKFRGEMATRFPELQVDAVLMSINGEVLQLS